MINPAFPLFGIQTPAYTPSPTRADVLNGSPLRYDIKHYQHRVVSCRVAYPLHSVEVALTLYRRRRHVGRVEAGGGHSAVSLHSLDAANATTAIGDAHRDPQTRAEGAAEVFHLVA